MNIAQEIKDHEWRKSLKPGDKIAYQSSSFYPPTIYVVVRLTKTQIVTESEGTNNEVRFAIDNGTKIGDKSWRRITPVSQEIIDKRDGHEIRTWLSKITGNNPTVQATANQLRAMRAAYEAAK